jgi:hypothetical protein
VHFGPKKVEIHFVPVTPPPSPPSIQAFVQNNSEINSDIKSAEDRPSVNKKKKFPLQNKANAEENRRETD